MSGTLPVIMMESARDHSWCGCCLSDADLQMLVIGRKDADDGKRYGSSTGLVMCLACRILLLGVLELST